MNEICCWMLESWSEETNGLIRAKKKVHEILIKRRYMSRVWGHLIAWNLKLPCMYPALDRRILLTSASGRCSSPSNDNFQVGYACTPHLGDGSYKITPRLLFLIFIWIITFKDNPIIILLVSLLALPMLYQ